MSTVQTNCKDCHVCTYARLIEMFMKLTHGGQCKCPDSEDLQSTLSGIAYSQLFSQESFNDNNTVSENDEDTITLPSSVVSSIHEAEPYMSEGLSREDQVEEDDATQTTIADSVEEDSTETEPVESTTEQTNEEYSTVAEANVFKPYSYNPFEGPEVVPSKNVGWSWNPDVTDYADKWFGPENSDVESQIYVDQEKSEDSTSKALNPSFNWYIS